MCDKEFEGNWTDEEAEAEVKSNFGKNITKEDCDIICDDCYEKCKPTANLGMFEKYLIADLKRNML